MKLFIAIGVLILVGQNVSGQDLYKSIYFGGGSYYIDIYQERELQEFIKSIPYIYQYEIEIHGHTDDIGTFEYNMELAKMRTREVYFILNQMSQLKSDQINIIDFGETNPLYDNATMEGKFKNRRVDVIIKRVSA